MSSRFPESPDLDPGASLEPVANDALIDQASLELVELREPIGSARDLSISMARISAASVCASSLPGLRVIDSVFDRTDCSGATWIDTRLVRCVFDSCKCTGLDTRGGTLRDVRFSACKMPDAFMQESTLDRVWFESCNLNGLDLSGSTLDRVTIRECDARNLRLLNTRITALDLRGSRIDGLAIDPGSVRHLIIDPVQAPALAESLGTQVIDAHEDL